MNHVLLAFAEEGAKDIQHVVDEAVKSLRAAVERFDSTAAWLLSEPRDALTSHAHLCAFIHACRENCTGKLEWT